MASSQNQNPMKVSIFLFAGEKSGDLHGEKLLQELKKSFPQGKFFGVGGPNMRKAGLRCICPMENFQVMGFVDVFLALHRLVPQFFFLRQQVLKNRPDIVLLIDSPGFSLKFASSLRKKGYRGKICQYICPSVWAWGKNRIAKMEQLLDHLFVTFPFEKKLFQQSKLDVQYVGHPLVQEGPLPSKSLLNISNQYQILALFPGSRRKEIIKNFPKQLQVAKRLIQRYPSLYLAISCADPSYLILLKKIIDKEKEFLGNRWKFIPFSQNQELIDQATLAIAKSGTVTLELALRGVPTIVTYAINPLDLFIAKTILRVNLPNYCIVNILANKRIFPEFYGPNFKEQAVYEEADKLLSNDKTFQECREKSLEIAKILGDYHPEKEITKKLENLFYAKRMAHLH